MVYHGPANQALEYFDRSLGESNFCHINYSGILTLTYTLLPEIKLIPALMPNIGVGRGVAPGAGAPP